MANNLTKIVEQKVRETELDQFSFNIDTQSSLALSSYILFGKPWKKMS